VQAHRPAADAHEHASPPILPEHTACANVELAQIDVGVTIADGALAHTSGGTP